MWRTSTLRAVNSNDTTVVGTAPDANDELIISVAAVAAHVDASALGDYVYTATARVISSGADIINEDRPKE